MKPFLKALSVMTALALLPLLASADDIVGKITRVDLDRRLVTIDVATVRLLESTTITHVTDGKRRRPQSLVAGQVVKATIENDSLVKLVIMPFNDVPM